ncbi:helix-turn-helix transcriptional regulator [Micromonospora sp. NPDC006766]|uniref:helix-turn-helix transcriptional regulator n=1 Tax=Micromonospora sp. NPDC006766 TaxID=3154778 RepID=UPI0034041BAB
MSGVYAGRFADLDPADTAARRVLIGQLRGLRDAAGLNQRQVAQAMGWKSTTGALYRVERGDNWQLRTLQTLARLYGQQLTVNLGAPVPDDGDPLAAMYAAMHPTTPAAADELARAVLVRNLVRIRVDRGLRQEDVACVIGISDRAVRLWEQGSDGVMVAPAQRYARALEAPLTFRLAPLAEPLPDTPLETR